MSWPWGETIIGNPGHEEIRIIEVWPIYPIMEFQIYHVYGQTSGNDKAKDLEVMSKRPFINLEGHI